jgi:hypothetical protein
MCFNQKYNSNEEGKVTSEILIDKRLSL